MLSSPRVNIASSHVIGCDVRAPDKICVCQNNHCVAFVWRFGWLEECVLEELVCFDMPQAVGRLRAVLGLRQYRPSAVGTIKITVPWRCPLAEQALLQV